MALTVRDSHSYETQIIDAVRSVNRALGGTYGTSSAIHKPEFNQYEVQLIDAIKGWELGPDSLTFKDTDTITSMSEVNGNTLYDYLKYGLNYIKLIRNVLAYYVTKSLIDENGNITNYTNDNEIVQIVVPVDEIDLTVSLDSVLLTE